MAGSLCKFGSTFSSNNPVQSCMRSDLSVNLGKQVFCCVSSVSSKESVCSLPQHQTKGCCFSSKKKNPE